MANMQTLEEIRADLRPASFGGVSFQVKSATGEYGHRSVVHEFPNSDNHYTEQLGRKARRFRVEGYIPGSVWQSGRDRLILAVESGDALTFRHPFYKQFKTAKALSLSTTEDKDELGLVRFSMELVEEVSISPLLGIEFVPHLIQVSLDNFVTDVAGSLTANLDIRNFGDAVRTTGVGIIQDWAGALEGARTVTALGSGGAELATAISGLFNAAEDIIDGDDISGTLSNIVDLWRTAVETPTDGAAGLFDLIYEGVDLRPSTSTSTTSQQKAQTSIVLNRTFRRTFGGLWAELTASRDFPGRAEASVSRNNVVRWVDSEAQLIDALTEPEVCASFDRLRSRVIEDITAKWSNSEPVIDIRLPRQQSAIYIADKLYGDPTRAASVWERNPSSSPSLIGPDIEVLVR